MLTLNHIQLAKERLNGIIKETPLIYSKVFSDEYNNNVYIKPENLQTTGAFKIRGAYNKLYLLQEELKPKGLVTSSAGNHAQGVANAAQKLNIPATIVMPKQTPLIKVEATKAYGAKVILHGTCYDEAYEKAKSLESQYGYEFIHPFDDLDVIAGQGTIGLEILDELMDTHIILVPVGGGGLISGIVVAAKAINPNIKVIGVEPEGANSMHYSISKQKRSALKNVHTIAEGVAVKVPGSLTFDLTNKYVDEIITVSDVAIMEVFLMLLEKEKVIAEAAGALSLAALRKLDCTNKNIVSIISGGNIDVVTISEMINRGLVSRGRRFCFSVELNDSPGQMQKISSILANQNANIIQLDHSQGKTVDRFMQVLLEVTVETNGHAHVKEIIDELEKEGYKVNIIY